MFAGLGKQDDCALFAVNQSCGASYVIYLCRTPIAMVLQGGSSAHVHVLIAGAFGAYVVRYLHTHHHEAFAYLLSTGIVGVVYDDGSRMLAMPSVDYMCYLPIDSGEVAAQSGAAESSSYTMATGEAGLSLQAGQGTALLATGHSINKGSCTGQIATTSQNITAGARMGAISTKEAALLVPFLSDAEGRRDEPVSSSSSSLPDSRGGSKLSKDLQGKVALMQRFTKCLLRQGQDGELVSGFIVNLSVSVLTSASLRVCSLSERL
jgi:hypothetical protein